MKQKATDLAAPHVAQIIDILTKAYPKAHIALNYSSPWELLVAVILSAQCTDIKVNEVTATLFAKYPTLESYVSADVKEFEKDIHATGFYHAKAKNVLATAKILKERFGGRVPKTMEEMVTLPGVARKTANVVLGNVYNVVVGIAVDTHVLRLSQRLGLVDSEKIGGKEQLTFEKQGKTVSDFKKDADPVRVEQELMQAFPKKEWFSLTYKLIDHGRAICKAKRPLCEQCVLSAYCPASRV